MSLMDSLSANPSHTDLQTIDLCLPYYGVILFTYPLNEITLPDAANARTISAVAFPFKINPGMTRTRPDSPAIVDSIMSLGTVVPPNSIVSLTEVAEELTA
jgi:hypothetical protein